MARKKNIISKPLLELLRQKVATSFGKPVNYGFECETLSHDINKHTHEYLSPQSLRRFFGFLPSDFSPAINTLNILSRYCKYFDWNDFAGKAQKKSYTPLTSKEEIQLYLDFYNLKLQDEKDINFHNACRIINSRILSNGALFDSLAKPLAENLLALVFFYERFPFIDGLCSGYDRGVSLYLQNTKEKEESQVYGICLLILGAFLSEDQKLLRTSFAKLGPYHLHQQWHPFIIARFIGSHLLFYHTTGQEERKNIWLEQAQHYGKYFSSASRIGYWKFPYYQFMICDYLNLVKEYLLSNELMYPIKKRHDNELVVEEGYFDALCIIAGISLIGLGKPGQAVKKWELADCDKLGIVFKKYFTIQFLTGELQSTPLSRTKKRKQLQDRSEQLIEETGFVYFRNFLK